MELSSQECGSQIPDVVWVAWLGVVERADPDHGCDCMRSEDPCALYEDPAGCIDRMCWRVRRDRRARGMWCDAMDPALTHTRIGRVVWKQTFGAILMPITGVRPPDHPRSMGMAALREIPAGPEEIRLGNGRDGD